MQTFFSNQGTQQALIKYRDKINKKIPTTSFEESRNEHIVRIFNFMIENPEAWDNNTQINIEFFSESFFNDIKTALPDDKSLDLMFSANYRFLMEYYISTPEKLTSEARKIKEFAKTHYDLFCDAAQSQIDYANNEMIVSMFKSLYNNEELAVLKNCASVIGRAEQLKDSWDNEIENKKEQVEALKVTLTQYQNAFNFVGLYNGFSTLSENKEKQLKSAKYILMTMVFILPLIIIVEMLFFIYSGEKYTSAYDLIKIIPSLSLLFIMAYYFRIALQNHNSIKAQIMQIELRKTLCQFIQNYAEYSSKIRGDNKELLSKFEDVVFSNIMATEEKIPSTYDGIEQISQFITALKKN